MDLLVFGWISNIYIYRCICIYIYIWYMGCALGGLIRIAVGFDSVVSANVLAGSSYTHVDL